MTPGRLVVVAALVSAALAVVLALHVPAGQPYDEPSHLATVEHYATHHDMPVMGDPGVTYEAQMGPVYYSAGGLLWSLGDAVSGPELAFRLVRLSGAAVCLALAALAFPLLRTVLPGEPWSAAWGTTLLLTNPALLFVVASVQNDGLVLVVSTAFLLVALRAVARRSAGWVDGVLLGVLGAVAVLTKVNALAVVAPAMAVVLVATWRRGAGRAVGLGSALVVALTSWWFIRNQVLYGTLDGRSGLERTGAVFTSEPLDAGSLWRFVRLNLFAYLWTPVEYLRNAVRTPPWWTGISVLASAGAVVGWIVRWMVGRRRPGAEPRVDGPWWRPVTPARAAATVTAFTVLTFAASYFGLSTTALAGRFVYPVLPFLALGLAAGLERLIAFVGRRTGPIDGGGGATAASHAVLGALAVLGVAATVQIAFALPTPASPFISFRG